MCELASAALSIMVGTLYATAVLILADTYLLMPEQECLMHLLVAPGSSGRNDEPSVSQIDWHALK